MQHARAARRFVLIALTLLSACAASDPSSGGDSVRDSQSGIGRYLAGRFAVSEGDAQTAANDLLKAVEHSPPAPELTLEAFLACVNAGRPEAVTLARQLPDNQIALLVLADADIKAGRWQDAETRFHAMPRQGMSQLLQPLLVAWAEQGDNRTDTALSTLRSYVDNPRFRALFALQAAMIADLGNRLEVAGVLYRGAQAVMSDPSLRVAQILASWQARSGQAAESEHTLAALEAVAPDLGIAMPALLASVTKRPVPRAADGVAEAYFTFAALLRSQDANDFSLIMLRLALDLRPDFAAARLLAADILGTQHHLQAAYQVLNEVPATDPLSPVVRLRRAALTDRMGRPDDAMRELERMAREYPDSPLPDQQRGDILRTTQRFTEAVAAYDKGIARITNPTSANWVLYYDRGVAEERSHQWPKAKADFQHALQLSPDQPFVLNYLGYSLADMGHQLEEARQMVQTAAARRPNDGAITDSLGWVMFRQGHIQESVNTLERAVELEPEDSTINEHLGDAYFAAGRKIEAQYQWRRALTLNPTPDDAVKLEAKLSTGHPNPVLSGQ